MADTKPNPCIVKWNLFTCYLNSPPLGRAAARPLGVLKTWTHTKYKVVVMAVFIYKIQLNRVHWGADALAPLVLTHPPRQTQEQSRRCPEGLKISYIRQMPCPWQGTQSIHLTEKPGTAEIRTHGNVRDTPSSPREQERGYNSYTT